MFLEERQEQIMQRLLESQSVRITDLVEEFGVTRETLRKDLYHLEKQGLIRKVHGGAVLNKTDVSNEEPPYNKRSLINPEEKEKIAKRAAELVEDGDTLYLDIGTTTLLFAKQLKSRNNITIITNSLLIAMELGNQTNLKVILSGGELRPGELSLSGPSAIQTLQNYYIDKAFVGVGGLSEDSGFTDYHIYESEIRTLMLNHAKEKYALVDHSKMHITAFYKSADMQDMDVVITDAGAPLNLVKTLQSHGVEVIMVE
ncbi:DeoR/GlpR transcriptional regulator [Paenibacillus frigoriresistens]|uniref:DeoR/GlpR family DNA-binding transcription regulator n=1 Tax=Paenibacillus alginolyticus TaxID=59839 RepID=UPI001562F200|nr:DeoR/GlpR family DNA-binding transcription regulator [Paenibacillus frigoriresistens]NRF94539.1 DeoR/GlpR transcriptional regulator [Paenibacillus frigoriresistens]